MESDPEKAAEAQLAAQAELGPGERLLWTGRPMVSFGGAEMLKLLPVSFFGLFFAGFAAFWIWGAAGYHLPRIPDGKQPMDWFHVIFPLWGLPFLAVGLGMVTSPLWAGLAIRRLARGTVYAVTDQRVLVLWLGKSKTVVSWNGNDIAGGVTKTERPDGSGDLIFTNIQPTKTVEGPGAGRLNRAPGLYGVPDVRTVERLVLDKFGKK